MQVARSTWALTTLFLFFFLVALGLSCCMRAFSSCSEWVDSSLRCTGFPLRQLPLLPSTDSMVHGPSSHGPQASLPPGMWNLPRPGIEPVSLALQSEFLNHLVHQGSPLTLHSEDKTDTVDTLSDWMSGMRKSRQGRLRVLGAISRPGMQEGPVWGSGPLVPFGTRQEEMPLRRLHGFPRLLKQIPLTLWL